MTQILINDHNTLVCPSQRQCSFTQGILAGSAFRIFKDLVQGALTNIQTGLTCEMMSGHMLKHINGPAFLWVCLSLRNCVSCCRSLQHSTAFPQATTRKGWVMVKHCSPFMPSGVVDSSFPGHH